jgi:hypothetical protein
MWQAQMLSPSSIPMLPAATTRLILAGMPGSLGGRGRVSHGVEHLRIENLRDFFV